jgi:hypothetical protein
MLGAVNVRIRDPQIDPFQRTSGANSSAANAEESLFQPTGLGLRARLQAQYVAVVKKRSMSCKLASLAAHSGS